MDACSLSHVWTARAIKTGTPAALWGAAILNREDSGTGTYWMLATDALHGYEEEIVTLSQLVIIDMLETFHTLENFVDTRCQASLQLLARIGFTVSPGFVDQGSGRTLHFAMIESSNNRPLMN